MSPGTKLDKGPEGLSGNGLQLSFSKEFCPPNKPQQLVEQLAGSEAVISGVSSWSRVHS